MFKYLTYKCSMLNISIKNISSRLRRMLTGKEKLNLDILSQIQTYVTSNKIVMKILTLYLNQLAKQKNYNNYFYKQFTFFNYRRNK